MNERTWVDVLKEVGWPTTVMVIDFETYWDSGYTLAGISPLQYILDPRFEITGMGTTILKPKENPSHRFEPGYAQVESTIQYSKVLYGDNFENITVIIQNAPFDAAILLHKFGVNPPFIIDIKHLSRHRESRASHRLADIAKTLKLPAGEKGDTTQFKGKHYEDFTHEEKVAFARYTYQDIRLETEAFIRLLPQVSNPKVELPIMRHTLKLYLESPVRFDFEFAAELQEKMGAALDEAVQRTGHTEEELSGDISFTELLIAALPDDQSVPVKPHKRPPKRITELLGQPGVGPALAKTDDGCKWLLQHPDDKVRILMEGRQAAGSWPNHMKRIANMRELAAACGGILPIPLNYYGGHTGRWSGSDRINVQNLGARSKEELINSLRRLLKTMPGYSFIIIDWAAVEAHGLAWIADETDLVEQFRMNADVYSVFATKLFRSRVRKHRDDDPKPLADLYKLRRRFGKDAILGCGYGMGAAKFFSRMLEDDDLRKLVHSGEYDMAFAKRIIDLYRSTYTHIPAFWNHIEKCFRWAVRSPGDTDVEVGHGIVMKSRGSTVYMQLPSGREMRYPHCAIKKSGGREQLRWHYGYLWGGTLTENVVQAICRDLLAEAILRAEDAGYPIVYHCHDEIVACVPDFMAQKALADLSQIMVETPAWAEGFPLSVEGAISKEYTK